MKLLRQIKLTDLKPGDVFGYSFVVGRQRRRYCVGICSRVNGKTLYVKAARCMAPIDGDPDAHEWEHYDNEAQSGYAHNDEDWELYVYDEDALWAAHCAEILTQ